MRILLSIGIIVVASVVLIGLAPHSMANEISRLHVVANSDEDMDQAVKILVRNRILSLMSEEQDIPVLKKEVDDYLLELDQVYSSRWEVGYHFFSETEYGGSIYPAGEYLALRIVLGEGQGQNWWCVLFPNLCMVEGITEEMEPEEIFMLLEEDIQVAWRLQELWPDFRKWRFWAMIQ